MLLFTIVGFRVFNNKYGFENEGPACDTLLRCFALHLDYGLRVAPIWVFGDPSDDGVILGGGFFFNVAYYVVVILIVTAIVSGIIIDSFSELRASLTEREHSIKNTCFVCGLDRDVLELRGSGFQKHVDEEHNMWHYVYFIAYLASKDPTLLNGQEVYALEMIRAKDVRLFPIRRARCVQESEDEVREQGEKLEAKMDELTKLVRGLSARVDASWRVLAQLQGRARGDKPRVLAQLQ